MLIRTPEQDIERVLFTEKAIAARVEQLGADLTAQLGDKRPVLVCVLKGASFFYIDLCRCMNCAIDMDFRLFLCTKYHFSIFTCIYIHNNLTSTTCNCPRCKRRLLSII